MRVNVTVRVVVRRCDVESATTEVVIGLSMVMVTLPVAVPTPDSEAVPLTDTLAVSVIVFRAVRDVEPIAFDVDIVEAAAIVHDRDHPGTDLLMDVGSVTD